MADRVVKKRTEMEHVTPNMVQRLAGWDTWVPTSLHMTSASGTTPHHSNDVETTWYDQT